ncbi:12357_t:CDS:2 [Racocetra fulgida]|uniref:12357_t:CDS:1 n=1 Tax=Racocetra fulgida TaxID=60492 RepID=A0A9N9GVF7_9GLOM|nr:12357_t:CDS:2 [Racocetra fulgida]
MQPLNVLENKKFHDFVYEAESRYQIPCQDIFKKKIFEAVNFVQDANREIRKDGKKLESLLLDDQELLGLKELINLLKPFACTTTLMGGDIYPTLSLMLPTITTLQEHLFQLNLADRWEDPKIEGYLAAILDPKFKNLGFASEKFEETKNYLRQKMLMLNKDEYLNEQPVEKLFSNLASFFNNITAVKKFSLLI